MLREWDDEHPREITYFRSKDMPEVERPIYPALLPTVRYIVRTILMRFCSSTPGLSDRDTHDATKFVTGFRYRSEAAYRLVQLTASELELNPD